MNKLTILCFILLVPCLLGSCGNTKDVEFKSMDNVKLRPGQLALTGQLQFSGDALLFNPNLVGGEVVGTDLIVKVDDQKVTTISQDISASMPANAEFILPLKFDIPLTEFIQDLKKKKDFKSLLRTEVNITIAGDVKVKIAGVKLNVDVETNEVVTIPLVGMLGGIK